MIKTLQIPVSEIMSRDLLIVKPEDTLDRVGEIFNSHSIHHIPVVEAGGELVGIVSKLDFMRVNHMFTLFDKDKYQEYNKKLHRCMQVKEIMTRRLAKLNPEDPLSVAIGIFQENLFHALPVVDGSTLVGMLTTMDVINYCCRDEVLLEN